MKSLEKLEETEVKDPADWCHVKAGQVVVCPGHSFLTTLSARRKSNKMASTSSHLVYLE